MRLSFAAAVACLGLSTTVGSLPHSVPPTIQFNDNLAPAGRLTHGVLVASLVAKPGDWFPYEHNGTGIQILAFGEAGKPLQDPGPVLRAPVGTQIVVHITNLTGARLVVHGLSARRQAAPDSLAIAPNETGTARFTADAAGTYYYWAATHGERFSQRWRDDSHLNGALIVDPAGVKPTRDRVFVIEREAQTADSAPRDVNSIYTINGRPWPYTERLTYDLGDSVRWRIINASDEPHPMHLHGFFFRVDARGDAERDTVYWPAQQRHEVTELVHAGTTMDMAWLADRPGGWVFHCHINFHFSADPALAPKIEPPALRLEHLMKGYPADAATHAEQMTDMGGLVLGILIRTPPGWHPDNVTRRTVRFLIESDSAPTDRTRRFEYSVDDGNGHVDSSSVLGPAIILHLGEPTRIWIVNHAAQTTQVHWHGLEVESAADGVVGMSGTPGAMEPPIPPGDSLAVFVTPRRAGSYMYHTHFNAAYQQTNGMYGPLIVLDTAAVWNPERDRVFIVGDVMSGKLIMNAGPTDSALVLRTGTPYRFRLMNMTIINPLIRFELVRRGAALTWTPIAKDAYPVDASLRIPTAARQPVSIGETYDFLVEEPDTGTAVLEVRTANGALPARQEIRFVH